MTPLQILGRQHWLRRGIRDRMLRQFASPERQAATRFEAPFFGKTYVGYLNNYLDWTVYYYGVYERPLMRLMGDLLKRGSVVMDVGANVGHHSLYFSTRASEVHAFEPYAPLRPYIEEKIARNEITNVRIHPFGLGEKNESLPFFMPEGSNQATGSFIEAHLPGRPMTTLEVRRGDDFGASLDRLDFVKIDVEGFEAPVLRGLRETFERLRPIVLFEYSDATREQLQDLPAITALFPAGYSIYAISRRKNYLWLFDSERGRLEPFTLATNDVLAMPH
jgi:FkbM family methyltransferase